MKEVLCLYGTTSCHLCDDALLVIDTALNMDYFEKKIIDIVDSDELMAAYGVRIPVLKIERTGDELGWPFDAAQLVAFIEKALL
ncbi:MAG: hypothetical protein COA99_04290 [Moraxellaceae bacterium]|nr:MAG: hypothetical protein COA99_04290 [Moraxellaceae bacterium]